MKRVLLLALALAACDQSMADQPKTHAQAARAIWPGGPPRQAAPADTVAQDQPLRDAALMTPPPLTPALVNRGEQRYGIYCVMCHGARGNGDGVVVQRGFPPPPNFHEARLLAAPASYIVETITHGHGVMYSYADRVAPADRWAIAAYVRALQKLPAEAPR